MSRVSWSTCQWVGTVADGLRDRSWLQNFGSRPRRCHRRGRAGRGHHFASFPTGMPRSLMARNKCYFLVRLLTEHGEALPLTDFAMSRPIVVTVCIAGSSELWAALTAPTSMALTCRWRSRPQHQKRSSRKCVARACVSSRVLRNRAGRYLNNSGRGSGMKPSRFGICTRGSVCASRTIALSIILPSARMKATTE